jgi:serine/threonine protein kinase
MRYEFVNNRLLIGDEEIKIDGVTFVDSLGAPGANAVVLRGKENILGRDIAVKVWLPRKDKKPIKDRFLAEIQKNAKVDEHENIVRVHTGGIINGKLNNEYYYAIMELVQGETLEDWLKKEHNFTQRYRVYRQIYQGAIAYSHKHNTFHGDLHPKNILITDNLKVKVLDFGTSRFAQTKEQSLNREKLLLIQTAKKILHEDREWRFLDLNINKVPPWYVRKVLENLGHVMNDIHTFLSDKDELSSDDDYFINQKIFGITSTILDYPCFCIENIYKFLEVKLGLHEIYLDSFISQIICTCEAKIKNPYSTRVFIFPDRTSISECLQLYMKWQGISIDLTKEVREK